MEAYGDKAIEFRSVIENLSSMFSHIISEEVIETLVESCDGDLNRSVDAIMKITNDESSIQNEEKPPETLSTPTTKTVSPTQQSLSSFSYAALAAQNKGAVPKQQIPKISKPNQDFWTDQIRQIMTHHNKGTRIMLLMRGAPGSGKSHLAKLLVESMVGSTFMDYKNHILSTDDYFMIRGQYVFDKYKLSYAHTWNQHRAKEAVAQGLSPIIIDNTNIEPWEMHPYLVEGVKNGYIIEIVEPNTAWAKKANQLFQRNSHNVPLNTIRRMLENYVEGVTGENLRRSFGLSYPSGMTPPVKRLVPPIEEENATAVASTPGTSSIQFYPPLQLHDQTLKTQIINIIPNGTENNEITNDLSQTWNQNEPQIESNSINEETDDLTQEELAKQKFVLEAQKRLEELEKFEAEWDNGEKWDENGDEVAAGGTEIPSSPTSTTKNQITTSSFNTFENSFENITSQIVKQASKPPRNEKKNAELNKISENGRLMESVTECNDWHNISLFLPPWVDPDEKSNIPAVENLPIEKTSSSTCVEVGDTDLTGDFKIISAIPRDINEFYVPPEREKIPEKRMFDKSTITNEGIVMTMNCPQKERHFIAFRKLFKYIERESLRYIFDNCCGDVNWAVDNVFGGGVEYQLKDTEYEEESDAEEDSFVGPEQPCTCLAKYDIIPHDSEPDELEISKIKSETEIMPDSASQSEKKKKDVTISDESLQLKRQIEQNVVISDSHYSEHCLKLRKLRRGEYTKPNNILEQPSTSGTTDLASIPGSTNNESNIDFSDDEDESNSDTSENDKIVSINVGRAFIKGLDDMFGRKDMDYPDNIKFNISIPTSLLNEINALWMESLMFQIDDCAKKSAAMLKQDEEFARQIALKEEELLLAGKKPGVPDFKEIMDLEFAISLHLKDMSEWKNNIPNDFAAKLTHDKLFNLFPEIEHDTLLELLMAHNNNFKTTVEVLLMSMGKNDILEAENGVSRFVMDKELERQKKMLEEQQELALVEWPPLPKNEDVEMSTVESYREQAEKHLVRRNAHLQKAEEYIRRGMPQVADYFSSLATFHKTKYEQANSMAVASLMQYHANNSPDGETVDLHYFRVKEAKETMDLFIDTHICKLRENRRSSIMLYFITGRGLHSPGQPRVKPACMKRLKARGLTFMQCNPGLLRARVSSEDKLSYQVP